MNSRPVMHELHQLQTLRTPFVRHPDFPRLFLKFEGGGMLWSHKDRSSAYIVADRIQQGLSVAKVVDRSSGSWANGLALAVALAGGETAFVTSTDPPAPIRMLVESRGGRFVKVQSNRERKAVLEEYVHSGYWTPDQHANSKVIEAFERTLGPQLNDDIETLDGHLRFLVAPIGTGGLLAGAARHLRHAGHTFEAIGVDLSSSLAHSGPRTFKYQHLTARGVGSDDEICRTLVIARANFSVIPSNVFEAATALRQLAMKLPCVCGMSGGLALAVAIRICVPQLAGDDYCVAILPDRGDSYANEMGAIAHMNGISA